jgi:hypothetical protein
MNELPDRDALEHRLAAARQSLHWDMQELRSQAQTLVDWRSYFRSHPWLYCGAAATLGYLIAPGSSRWSQGEGAARREAQPPEPAARGERSPQRPGHSLLGRLLRFAGNVVVSEAVGSAREHFYRKYSKYSPQTTTSSASPATAASPRHDPSHD